MSNGPRYRGKTFHEYMSAKFWHPASKRNIVTVWKRKQQMKVSSCNFISIVLMIIFRLKSANTMSVQKKPDVKTKRIWYNLHLGIKNPNLVSLSYMICQIILCQEVIYKISLHTKDVYLKMNSFLL